MRSIIDAVMDRQDESVHGRATKSARGRIDETISTFWSAVLQTSTACKMIIPTLKVRWTHHKLDKTEADKGETDTSLRPVNSSGSSQLRHRTMNKTLSKEPTITGNHSIVHNKSNYSINMLSTLIVAFIIICSIHLLAPSMLSSIEAVSADLISETIKTSGQYELPSSSIKKRENSDSRENLVTAPTSINMLNPTTALMIASSSNSQLDGLPSIDMSKAMANNGAVVVRPISPTELSTSASDVSATDPIDPSPTQLDNVALDVADSKKKKKMMKKKKKMEKKHKEWKKGKKHKKKKFEEKKKKGEMSKKKKGKKEKKKWGMEKKGHKKKGNFKKKKWGEKKKMKKGQKKGKKGHKMLKDKGHKKKGFKKIYHKEEWGKKKKWHDIKREKKWNTKQKKWKKKWHQEKGKKYKGKHMKKYHKKNKHGKKYKKEKKEKFKKHKGEKFKKGHKKKKEEYSKKKEGGKKKKEKKMKKEMKKKKG